MSAARALCRIALVLSSISIAACAGSGTPPPESPGRAEAKAAKPSTPRQELVRLLNAVPRGPEPLSAMEPALRKELDAFLSRVPERERGELARSSSPFARERPLLHVAAGGTAPEALYQLSSGPRLAQDLLTVRGASGRSDIADLVPVLRKVGEAAATRWLHDRAVDVAAPASSTVELMDKVDLVAITLGRWDIVRAARSVAAEKDPDNVDRFISLSRAAAHELDEEGAKDALERARRLGTKNKKQAGRLARAERGLAALETVRSLGASAADTDARLRLARAYLELGRSSRAADALAEEKARAREHLGVAAALVEAQIEGSLCPGVPASLGTSALCAVAWQSDERVSRGTKLLDSAWKSGKGRDDRSLQSYLALVHIAPWMYGSVSGTGGSTQAELRARFLERLTALEAAASEAAKASPRLEGAVIFARTIGAGFRAVAKGDTKPDPKERKQLQEAAAALIAKSPSEPLYQSAMLAAIALSFRDEDVQPLLAKMPEAVDASNELSYQVLRLWVGAAKRVPELAGSASGAIAELVPELGSDALERARLVLLLAESDAALKQNDKAYGVLEQVARPLTADEVPLELRLRAAIDFAGARARAGKPEEGAAVLERIVSSAQVTNADEKNLGFIAASYLFVLRARATKGAERVEYRDKLAALEKEPIGADAPAATSLWRALWQRQLDFAVEEERCLALKPCLEKARAKRAKPTPELDQSAGPEVAKLVRRGALPAGSLSLTFSFSSAGLEALVMVNPALLATEAPPANR